MHLPITQSDLPKQRSLTELSIFIEIKFYSLRSVILQAFRPLYLSIWNKSPTIGKHSTIFIKHQPR